jgi:hypothetical protein
LLSVVLKMNIKKVVRKGITSNGLIFKDLKFTIPAWKVHLLFSGGAGWVKGNARCSDPEWNAENPLRV